MLFGDVWGGVLVYLVVFGDVKAAWESLGVTWGLGLCWIEPCWSKPTILVQHWNARFFSTWLFWDIKIPKPPHKSFLKIIGLCHFLHFLGSSERYCLLQLLLTTLYSICNGIFFSELDLNVRESRISRTQERDAMVLVTRLSAGRRVKGSSFIHICLSQEWTRDSNDITQVCLQPGFPGSEGWKR